VEDYLRLNGKYLQEAEELLARGDYPQASEKLWGAAAEMIKAVAAGRGVMLGTHRSLGEFIARLNRERPDLNLADGFAHANNLHVNFYENHLPAELVVKGAEAVRNLVQALRNLL